MLIIARGCGHMIGNHCRNHTMTALITPVCDAAVALRVNREKTETALVQVK